MLFRFLGVGEGGRVGGTGVVIREHELHGAVEAEQADVVYPATSGGQRHEHGHYDADRVHADVRVGRVERGELLDVAAAQGHGVADDGDELIDERQRHDDGGHEQSVVRHFGEAEQRAARAGDLFAGLVAEKAHDRAHDERDERDEEEYEVEGHRLIRAAQPE